MYVQFRKQPWKALDEQIWLNASLHLGQTYLLEKNFQLLEKLLKELKVSCKNDEVQGEDVLDIDCYNEDKIPELMQVLALELDMCIETND